MFEVDFNVEEVRFHLVKENTLLFRGWFRDDNPEGRKIEVLLDETPMEVSYEYHKGIGVRQRYLHNKANVSEEIVGEIFFPNGIEGFSKLKIYSVLGEKRVLVRSLAKTALQKFQQNIPHYIESQSFDKGRVKIVGWCLDNGETTVSLIQKGNPVDAKISWSYRRDVADLFPEITQEIKSGFILETELTSKNGLELTLSHENKIVNIPIVFSKNGETPSSLQKVAYWVKTYGLGLTAQKVLATALGREFTSDKLDRDDYALWRKKYAPKPEEIEAQRSVKFDYEPLFSIVIPLYNPKEKFLEELIDSIVDQTYTNWELCLADGSGQKSKLKTIVDQCIAKHGDRNLNIRYELLEQNLGISENTNAAIRMATGDYIVLCDHDDIVPPEALFECAKAINNDRSIDVIYSDEDKIDMQGKTYFEPHFKSDFNIDLLCSMNYICHLFVLKASLLDEMEGTDEPADGKKHYLRSAFDGAQDLDFILRCCEKAKNIHHIPKILYHWRCHMDSTAAHPESKMYAFEAGRKAVEEHYKRCHIPARVEHGQFYGMYKTVYEWEEKPLISIIIPNKDHIEDLKVCMDSIDEKSTYRNYEFIIVENNSTEESTFRFYDEISKRDNVNVLYYEGDFNFSRINNFGEKAAKGDYLLLLNNDTELINPDGLWEMLGLCMREDVGIVGARLYYKDDTIQHAGVVLGFGGIAGHAFIESSRYENGYFSRIICAQDYTAVTAACMMTKRSVYDAVGGLSEDFKVAFNDIDFCMKVRELGKLVVYNPAVELYHYESKSRGLEDTPEKVERFNSEVARFIEKWNKQLTAGDPYYNPNLTLDKANFSLKE